MPRYTLVDRFGHVVWISDDAGQPVETPREQAQAFLEAKARWQVIVALELRGERLTHSGKVVKL